MHAAWLDSMTNGQQDAPDVRLLWSRTPTARNPYRCDRCGDPIAAGDRYDSVGLIEDGVFRHERKHFGADAVYSVSGCPKQRAAELAELEAQFAADKERYFPEPRP